MDTKSSSTDATDFLAGGGEMGKRMRAVDWSRTPLGAVQTWSNSLRTATSICLNSRFPMVIWWGRDLVLLYNDGWRPILGENKDRIALGSPGERIWPEIWDVLFPMFKQVLDEGKATWSDDKLLLVNRYGFTEEAYFTWSYSPICDDDGGVGGVFTAVTETTRRVIGERRLKTLRDLGERLAETKTTEQACRVAAATLAENPKDLTFAAIYLLSDDGKSAKLLGADGLVPGTKSAPEAIRIDGSGSDIWNFTAALAKNETQVIDDLAEKHGCLAAGAWVDDFTTRAVVTPLAKTGVQDRACGFLVAGISPRLNFEEDYRGFIELVAGHLATAISNTRAYEEERKRAEALAEIDRAKTVFFSNVSHEFRTPLTLILGPTEEMLSGTLGATTDIQRAHLTTLRYNAVRLQKLVNNLLDFARVEAGRIEASYEPVDIGLLTRDLASTFCSAVHRAGLLYIVNCPSMKEPVYVDREMWEKIVLNLLSNALKFTFNGAIEVSLHPDDGQVAVTVRDTGVGIPEEELPHLFDRFHRIYGSRSRTQEGSGIGLALVQELVKLHGGRLQVESTVGAGTSFTVFIPKGSAHLPQDRLIAPRTLSSTALGAAPYVEEALRWLPGGDQAETFALPDASTLTDAAFPGASSERILIADDNQEMRDYVKRLLEARWNVTVVKEGNQALEFARTQQPDLVLSDVMMPGLNGFELLRELRADERTNTIPVILLSARAGEEAKVEGLSAGADDYLVKPFTAKELIARVEAHLKLHVVRREAARSLRASEERYRTLVALLPAAVYTCEAPSGTITYYNERAAELWGRAPKVGDTDQRFCGSFKLWRTDGSLLPHDQTPMAVAVRDGREFRHQEVVIERPDGSRITVLVNIDPVRDEGGKIVGAINVFQDMTALKEAEGALRESEERFRSMADSSPIMIWMTDSAGRILFLNRAYVEYFGIHSNQTETFDWTEIVHPEDRAAYTDAFRSAIRECRPFEHQARLRRFDGQWRWFESRGNPIVDADGKMTGFIGSSPDITDIYESRQALKELDQRKDEFLANMSHEIRSPLTAIMGYADILLGKLADPEHIQCLKTIKDSGDYLIEIVNDILDLSKIEAGKLVLNIESVSPHAVLGEIHGLMDVRAREKALPLALRYDGVVPASIQTDRTRLRQVVINLVSNAIKFTERGLVEIVARFNQGDGLLQIEVIDTGIGITREQQAILFQPFTQVDSTSTRKYGGTGLGLSITRRLVEMLGGSISFESEPNKGSKFRVLIPTGAARAALTTTPSLSRVGGAPNELVLHGRHVLVVDDMEGIRHLVSKYITDAGGRPDAVIDGKAAIEAIEAATASDLFDAMVLDIHMPGMDGYEVAEYLRAKGLHIPIIALTASAMVGDREKCLQAGCDDYLTKPIDRRRLIQLIALHAQKNQRGYSGTKLKILVVDDSDAACQLMARILEKRGHEIRSAVDGTSAISIAREFRPNLIFLDIRLPDMNGYELMQRLREMNGDSPAKFIALSGFRPTDAPDFPQFDHFLEKPLERGHLESLLRQF